MAAPQAEPPVSDALRRATDAAVHEKWGEVLRLTESEARTPEALTLRAAAYSGLGDWPAAARAAKASLKQRERNAEAWGLLAYALYWQHDDPGARYAARRAKACPTRSADAEETANFVLGKVGPR